MRTTYRYLAYAIDGLIIVQAAAIAWAIFGFSKYIDDGNTFSKSQMEANDFAFTEERGFMIHGINGQMLIPLVGLILILNTRGHRRVGDMGASTYVVEQRYLDQPVILPGDAGFGYVGQSAIPGPFGQQPGYPQTGPPTQPFGQPTPYGQPPAYGQPGPHQQPPSAMSGTNATYEADKPVWDQERDTYIQFDTERNAWLEFDQKSQQWKPIST